MTLLEAKLVLLPVYPLCYWQLLLEQQWALQADEGSIFIIKSLEKNKDGRTVFFEDLFEEFRVGVQTPILEVW